ncbi:hypothetical protein Q4567_06110 [Aliiglaciecola sp. 2_MG-2023]|uniref:hypothetical protein n=1 Tax=unclassified Aliiglaciecola TaxID=2593648 RepID=UPI0026E37A97|nr:MULTISPECIES: hypothetical protein [unclassified Aliiglaciecola]MDO6710287.1 hypothetical protein [Aliiglaciecola sp. 2_MG-2023]MDO6751435.1 hypothetical protein [Aliiglaciecola sp. 1_MG-2023]
MLNTSEHPWKLVGPWYRPSSLGGYAVTKTALNRFSAPIIQKYADANFANNLVNEPQHSLRFNSEDFVQPFSGDPNQVITPIERAQSHTPLKLYLDTHSRFYVVVCELHCDVAGFPQVERNKVCEAGFVVRRRVPVITPELKGKVETLLQQRSQLQNDLNKVNMQVKTAQLQESQQSSDISGLLKTKSARLFSGLQSGTAEKLTENLQDTNGQLDQLSQSGDIKIELQGWKSSDLKGVGNWLPIEETPEQITEQVIPMYPLIADPTNPNHSANGKTLWFGVIPTSLADVDSNNNPRFDDADLYEIRCFVRRHHSQFPIQKNHADCCGDVIWSEATEGYQIAAHFDLDGTSHRPVNIKLPDLPAIRNQVNNAPAGRGASARIIAPAESSLNFATDSMDMPQGGEPLTRAGQQICFFSIFLFFIVAMFLFRLFLPILLFIFNLWFLLKLKFCIPPSFQFDAGLVGSLNFDGSFGADFNASIDAHVELMTEFTADLAVQVAIEGPDLEAKFNQPNFSITVNKGKDNEKTYVDEGVLANDLGLMIANGINASDDMRADIKNGGDSPGLSSLSLNELAGIFIAMQTEYQDVKHPELAGILPTPDSGLVYFEKVELNKEAA